MFQFTKSSTGLHFCFLAHVEGLFGKCISTDCLFISLFSQSLLLSVRISLPILLIILIASNAPEDSCSCMQSVSKDLYYHFGIVWLITFCTSKNQTFIIKSKNFHLTQHHVFYRKYNIYGAKFFLIVGHVEEAHVMKMVNVLKENHSQFPSNLDSPAKPHDSVSVVKKTVKKKAVKGDMQPTSEDRQGHNVRCSKRLLEKESTGQPPEKKSKMVDGDDDDIVVIEDTDDHDDEDEEEEEEEEKEEEEDMVMSWKEFYKRPSNQDTPTRTAYLSEYYKFVQTIHGGWVREDEALEHTRQVHRLMTTIDGDSDSIDCLLDRERVWDWVLPRIETQLSGRQLQKYLLSLEKFYRFIKWHSNFPPHLKVSKKTKKLATNLEQLCPNWRRSIHKIAEEKRWKCLLANPVYIQQRVSEAARRARLIRSVFKRASASTATSSEQNHAQEPTTAWPRRKK